MATRETPEFDLIFVFIGGKHLKEVPVTPGYFKLKPKPGQEQQFEKYMKEGYLSSDLMKYKFMGHLQQCIDDNNSFLNKQVKLRKHGKGPGIQLDVLKQHSQQLWYSVDLVVSFEINKDELYVAKPTKDEALLNELHGSTWRRSFSLEEKDLLSDIDRDNGIRKWCARMLKVLRDRETNLAKLDSYLIKTTLFHENKNIRSWKPSELSIRFIGLLKRLTGYLDSGKMPHFFIPSMNILKNMDSNTRINIAKRLHRILTSQSVMRKILENQRGGKHDEL